MKIIYSNISGGFIFAGQKYGEMLFSKVSLENYIEYFRSKDADLICLSEIHLESKTASQMVERLAQELDFPYYASLAFSASFLDTSKQIGMGVLSKYPITRQEEFIIPSPKLEVDKPNGEHWIMLDKGGQRVYLDCKGKEIAVVNFSYFPFHHFGRSVDEAEFQGLRNQLPSILLGDGSVPTIITGDFNTKGHDVRGVFPELFRNDVLKQAIRVDSTVIGSNDQLDHILYQPKFFRATNGFAETNGSDHLAIGAEITYKA